MGLNKKDYDAVIVGSGPNGLAAAITLQQAGLTVLLIEAKKTIGGGMRSEELTLPGFVHDVCSAIHPMAASSPFLRTLPLEKYGLQFVNPPISLAHPFDDGSVALFQQSLAVTAQTLGKDRQSYLKLMTPIVNDWPQISADVLAPFHFPKYPFAMARFGLHAVTSAKHM